jgi:hypothetical protein
MMQSYLSLLVCNIGVMSAIVVYIIRRVRTRLSSGTPGRSLSISFAPRSQTNTWDRPVNGFDAGSGRTGRATQSVISNAAKGADDGSSVSDIDMEVVKGSQLGNGASRCLVSICFLFTDDRKPVRDELMAEKHLPTCVWR